VPPVPGTPPAETAQPSSPPAAAETVEDVTT
jgi:hypothetical protein